MLQNYSLFNQSLVTIKDTKILISTLNAHSYNTVQEDEVFQKALQCSDVLLPDGISVVWAMRILTGEKLKKIAGADLFFFEMERLNTKSGTCFFLGSSEVVLKKIAQRANEEYPNVQVYYYSPPYKNEFSIEDNNQIIEAVNQVKPDVLFIGMTAPKQEKWAYLHFGELVVKHVCCIGAVFDFYAGKIKRAPAWMINTGIEWLYRLLKEPLRMWRRYLIGNFKFIFSVLSEMISNMSRDNYHYPTHLSHNK